MGVYGLETYLTKGAPKGCCEKVNIKEKADEYRRETGKVPVVVVDGSNCLRRIYHPNGDEWMLGGQIKDFVEAMENFVAAFKNIGVTVMFYFDGATPDVKRANWLNRRDNSIKKIVRLFHSLNKKFSPPYQLPPLFGGTGRFAAKFKCCCDVRVSLSDCDTEIADYARQQDCFAILSQDTDFVILQGARYYFSLEDLDTATMTASMFSREGLLKTLGLHSHDLLLLASLLGNDIIPKTELVSYHRRLSENGDIFKLLPAVVEDIKRWSIHESCTEEELQGISLEVFHDKNKAQQLAASIRSYRPASSEANDDVEEGEKWHQILKLAREKHLSCDVPPHLYPVMLGQAYELSVALEDYSKDEKLTAKIYKPLRQRIYGVLLHEKPEATTVKEWCIEGMQCCRTPSEVTITRIPKIENFHPGLLHLWHKECKPTVKWQLFSESLTQTRKLAANDLEDLGFPYVVPVAVLFYLQQECEGQLERSEVDAILAHAAIVKSQSAAELRNIRYQRPRARVLYMSTIFHRGVTTVFFLLAACGFQLDMAMPWFYFDGKLLHEKYIQATVHGARDKQLCNGQEDVYRNFRRMKDLITSV